MNCQQAKRLLPLCIGSDLPDDADAEALRAHFARCPQCFQEHQRFQESLEALQSASTASLPTGNSSLWPRLMSRLKEMPRQRDHFNGWIPAAAMALAAALMIAVSVSQVRRDMGRSAPITWQNGPASSSDNRDLFTDTRFVRRNVGQRDIPVRPVAVPVNGPPASPPAEYQW